MKTDSHPSRSSWSVQTGSARGMTLLELLVAFAIFILLIAALVGLATLSLDSWTAGESRKDTYDRAQAILAQISEDLRSAYSENEYYFDGRRNLMPAAMICDLDANNRQRLRFVRGGEMTSVQIPWKITPKRYTPSMYYGDFWEVSYLMDADPAKNVLHRGIRTFDRRAARPLTKEDEYTLFSNRYAGKSTDQYFFDNSSPVETGVLYLGFKFWTQETVSWRPARTRFFTCETKSHQPLVESLVPGNCPRCGKPLKERFVEDREAPSSVWDSTRNLLDTFRYFRRRTDRTNPDFVYPEIVQIELVVESTADESRGPRLLEGIDEKAASIRVNETKGLADAPAMVKIDGEWIEYDKLSFDEIRVKTRGARGTIAVPHAKGSSAHFGETFVLNVRLPTWRHAVMLR